MKLDIINHHEDQQGLPYQEFIGSYFYKSFGKSIPAKDKIIGHLAARINAGRWIVDCPNCKSAVVASFQNAIFICSNCGSPENNGKWYKVLFPADKEDIEKELLKRPKVENRNLELSEDLEMIKKENKEHGII